MYVKTFLSIVAIILFNVSIAQKSKSYSELIEKAEIFYEKEKYLKAGHKYAEAFLISQNDPYIVVYRYHAACSWAQANEVDSSFVQLFIFADELFSTTSIHSLPVTSLITGTDSINTDAKLTLLHTDPRWEEFIKVFEENKAKTVAQLDMNLVMMLDSVYMDDQEVRNQIDEIGNTYGWESEVLKSVEKKMKEQDSLNLIKIEKILNERGWLGPDFIGYIGNLTLWLVIQHSAPAILEKYLPMMREAAIKGDARADHLAYLEDRNNKYQNRKQLYGSQFATDSETEEGYVWPLEDPDNVDKRRSEVGLGTMQEYLAEWGNTWDLEAHKKRIAEFEAKQKK